MESAFGIDHGHEEIAKLGFGGLGGAIAGGTRKLATGLGRGSAGLRRGAATNPSAIGGAKMKLGTAGGRAAGGLRKLGQGMASRPGLTGGVAAGGAAAGVGGGAAAIGNRRRF
jgi:hypothetical protein